MEKNSAELFKRYSAKIREALTIKRARTCYQEAMFNDHLLNSDLQVLHGILCSRQAEENEKRGAKAR